MLKATILQQFLLLCMLREACLEIDWMIRQRISSKNTVTRQEKY